MTSEAIRFLLEDMRAYAAEAIEITGDRESDEIVAERLREHGVLRTVQIVGEAAAQVLRLQPEGLEGVELREATRIRNILVHGYGKIRMNLIVSVVRDDLPRLITALDRVLGKTIT